MVQVPYISPGALHLAFEMWVPTRHIILSSRPKWRDPHIPSPPQKWVPHP
jgi:hypothetical protein